MTTLRSFAAAALAALTALAPLALLGGCDSGPKPPAGVLGDPQRGKLAVTQYACHSCHVIPGVTGSDVAVGRPLEDIGKRRFIAGGLLNNQPNLMHWIRDPQSVYANSAMPNLGVTENDARDISAYLLTLD